MPRTRSLAWSELKIGVLTIVSIAIAGVLIFALTGTRGFAWQREGFAPESVPRAGLTGQRFRRASGDVGRAAGGAHDAPHVRNVVRNRAGSESHEHQTALA